MNIQSSMDTVERQAKVAKAFKAQYSVEPELWVRAPGRVDLMGSHTDYNEGSVMTLAIDRDTWIAAVPRDDETARLASMNMVESYTLDLTDEKAAPLEGWGLYAQGTIQMMREAGCSLKGFDALVHGTVPLSSGLSSSASLESAFATLLEQLSGKTFDKVEKAKICQRAENVVVGVNCGILDQYSSILGEKSKALMLDCRNLTHDYADFPSDMVVVICNTKCPRNLTGSEYGDRRAQCEAGAAYFQKLGNGMKTLRDVSLALFEEHEANLDKDVAKRSKFIIQEHARVEALGKAFSANDREAISAITAASFAGARDLFEISVPAMEAMIEAMHAAPGVVGARQAGAGFGGCMVSFVEADKVEEYCKAVAEDYQKRTDIEPEIYQVHTATGASVL